MTTSEDSVPAVRTRDPQGSHDAEARQTVRRITPLKQDIIAIFRENGRLTQQELVDLYGEYQRSYPSLVARHTDQSIRSRANELRLAGVLRNTGDRKLNANGIRVALWELVPEAER
jgi:hypothetical protein